jgi:hypothetical protein
LGLKVPRGFGWLTNPKRALYNRLYNRTTIGCGLAFSLIGALTLGWFTITILMFVGR